MAELQNLFRLLTIKINHSTPEKLQRALRTQLINSRSYLPPQSTLLNKERKVTNFNLKEDDIDFFGPKITVKNYNSMYIYQEKKPKIRKNEVEYQNQFSFMGTRNMSEEASTNQQDDYNTKLEENLKKLNKLRSLPRGSNIESRVAAIKSLLGKREVFRTLQNLRWPQGVICPRCSSKNITVKPPPRDAEDDRTYYDCLNCRKRGEPSGFDDLTGLGDGGVGDIQRWILCWYLLGFCSLSQVAKILGLSMAETLQLAEMGAQFTEFGHKQDAPKEKGNFFGKSFREKQKDAEKQKKEREHKDKMYTESESLGIFKPGPKSRK